MSEPRRAAVMQMRMQRIRNNIDQEVEEMVENARSMIDWKHYVRTYPWVCLGTAVALGYLIVPKRFAAVRPRAATSARLPTEGQTGVAPLPSILHGVVDGLWATAINVALRQGTAYVGLGVGKLFGKAGERPAGAKLDGTGERACPLR